MLGWGEEVLQILASLKVVFHNRWREEGGAVEEEEFVFPQYWRPEAGSEMKKEKVRCSLSGCRNNQNKVRSFALLPRDA